MSYLEQVFTFHRHVREPVSRTFIDSMIWSSCCRCWQASSPPRSRWRWRGFRYNRLRFAGWRTSTNATEAKLFRQPRSAVRIAGRDWMLTGEVPASAILVDAQSMAGIEMPSEHLGTPPAFEANDIIPVN
jgi:hypothetical protein